MARKEMRTAFAASLVLSWLAWPVHAAAAESYSLKNSFGMSVSIRPDVGDYLVVYQGQQWLGQGTVSVLVGKRWYRSAALHSFGLAPEEGRLSLRGANRGSGKDV